MKGLLKQALDNKESEADILQTLLNNGYKVEVINPKAKQFNQKYKVFKDGIAANEVRLAVVDKNGKVIAEQG